VRIRALFVKVNPIKDLGTSAFRSGQIEIALILSQSVAKDNWTMVLLLILGQ
jgi:hypothetical protein